MKKYASYQIDDFLKDDFFVDWVLTPTPASENHWNEVFYSFPTVIPAAEEAKKILLAVHIKPSNQIPSRLQEAIVAHVTAQLDDAPESPRRKKWLFQYHWWWMTAACLVLGIVWFTDVGNHLTMAESSGLVYRQVGNNTSQQKIANTSDKPLLLLLPDNSTVVLDPKSHIIYNAYTFAANRQVFLDGEAFFEVQAQENKPFFVKTNHLIARVVGTSFRVRASDEPTECRVIVSTGLVEVQKVGAAEPELTRSFDHINAPLPVAANEEALFDASQNRLMRETLSQETDLSKEAVGELFNFRSTPLKTVLATLGQRYRVTITIQDAVLTERTITASLSDLHLYEKLDLISKAAEANYQIVDGKILFYADNNTNLLNDDYDK
ncbi:FecR family protein [Parapedobacter sp. DT-150]|uniref:FecR family protein n=1 Tax=Parapedobacter sp. DT-150 TaxID=3396162 RepID=UPI003F1A8C84